MICPKCQSSDVVIATASNGFGTWKCNRCNASGSYPPETGWSSTLSPDTRIAYNKAGEPIGTVAHWEPE